MENPVGEISVSTLLQNLSGEAGRLEHMARRLDDALGDAAASKGASFIARSMDLQDLDALRQSLHAFAQITASASEAIHCDDDQRLSKADLSKGVKLEKVLVECLRTQSTKPKTFNDAACREPEFFEEF